MSIGRVPGATGIQPSIVDAKGDLIVATAADSVDRLAVGSANQVLTVDSSTATGLKWATPAAGGKVLQVVSATYSTQTNNATSTYADTGLTASITPSATNSKILVICDLTTRKNTGNTQSAIKLQLLRGATTICEKVDLHYTNSDLYNGANTTIVYMDSPSTTSSTTYKLQFANTQNAASVTVNYNGSNYQSIHLLEIGA